MSKRSRRSRPSDASGTTAPATSAPSTGSTRPARPTASTRRARPTRKYDDRSFLERYRTILLTAFLVIGLGVIGAYFLTAGSRPAYACGVELTPGPSESLPAQPAGTASPEPTGTPAPDASTDPEASPAPSASPAPEATPRLGFTTRDMGNQHVTVGSTVNYAACPPTSGDHYNAAGQGPLPRQFYGPEREPSPGGWVHNLEHGYVVALYSCKDGDCPSQEELDEMRTFFDTSPPTPGATACGIPNKVLVLRFDQMSTRFALTAWDRLLLMDTFDVEQALTFAEQWIDSPVTPEQGVC